jgi:cytochrome P450
VRIKENTISFIFMTFKDTQKMMNLLSKEFQSGLDVLNFIFPRLPRNILPKTEREEITLQIKSVMRELIYDHLNDIDYDNPRDFIDVYLKQIRDVGESFEIEQLVIICLDLFAAGAETTR